MRTRLRHGVAREVLRCDACSLVFLTPKPAIDYSGEEYRALYSPVIGQKVSPKEIYEMYLPYYRRYRLPDVRPSLRRGMRVLEIGCHTGVMLTLMRPYVREVIGSEYDKDAAEFCRALGFTVYDQPLAETPLEPASFDAITMFQVLEHVDDPIAFLTQVRGYLKPGGRLIVEVPNVDDWLLSVFSVPGYEDFYYRAPHVFYYSTGTLRAVMTRGGFRGRVRAATLNSNFMNQMHWLCAGRPQPDATWMYGPPVLPLRGEDRAVRAFFDDLDRRYRRFVARRGQARSLFFVGTPAARPA